MAAASVSKSSVPWNSTRPALRRWAVPETLRPHTVMSLRPVASAGTPREARAERTGSMKRLRLSPAASPASEKREKLRLPRSWYTAPPPVARRTTATPCASVQGTSTSSAAFWLSPKITEGAFCQSMSQSALAPPLQDVLLEGQVVTGVVAPRLQIVYHAPPPAVSGDRYSEKTRSGKPRTRENARPLRGRALSALKRGENYERGWNENCHAWSCNLCELPREGRAQPR